MNRLRRGQATGFRSLPTCSRIRVYCRPFWVNLYAVFKPPAVV